MVIYSKQPLLFSLEDIHILAGKILDLDPDPAPHYLVLRDILRCPPEEEDLQRAERALYESHWAASLADAQLPDGSWGRFHSQDTQVKTPFPTSEFAIRKALALGLDGRSPILQKASAYIQAHLEGGVTWTDRVEKQDHPGVWSTNIRTISGGMLALIEPDHPLLDPLRAYWADVVAAAFAGGSYDREAESAREQILMGIPSRRMYPFHAFYPLPILSSKADLLPPELEQQMIANMLQREDGMYYVCPRRLDVLRRTDETAFESWLTAQEILARFKGWKAFAPDILDGLWTQHRENGLWDIRKGSFRSVSFPLSESWRKGTARMVDCSVRILSLMRRYFDR